MENILSLYMKSGRITGHAVTDDDQTHQFSFDLPAAGDVNYNRSMLTTKELFLRLKEEWTIARHDAAHMHASKAAMAHVTRSKLLELGASSPRKATRKIDIAAANFQPGTPFDVQV